MHLKISESPAWLDDQMGGQFYGYVTGTANLTCQVRSGHFDDQQRRRITEVSLGYVTSIGEGYVSDIPLTTPHIPPHSYVTATLPLERVEK